MAQSDEEKNVVETEMPLPDDEYIVSRTDVNGIITYVSDSFCRISEYTREELMGRPHSIIRHPDMPRSAFKDMWETIKKGRTWRGYVKNRTKTGKYYWVDATVSPFVKDGTMMGYKSVRQKPDPDILAEKKYQYSELRATEYGQEEQKKSESEDAFKLNINQMTRVAKLAEKLKVQNSKLIDLMLDRMEEEAGE